MSDRRDEKALESVVSEARAERVPELDWAKMGAKLDELPAPSVPREPSALRFLVPPLALAAAAAVAYFAWPEPPLAPVVTSAPAVEVEKVADGDALVPGSRVQAHAERHVVSHPRRATWTLEPGSLAEVVRTGDVITVRLLAGSVSAAVVPSARPETFVIEARDMRVAVRGTRFRVALAIEGVDVDVSEGRVMVGSRERPGIGKLLVGPASEHFSPVPIAERSPVPASPPAGVRPVLPTENPKPLASAGAAPAVAEVREPSPGAVDSAALHAIELTSACFRQRSVGAQEPSPPTQTTLTMKARADGSISSLQFAPPLARQVEVCVRDGLRSLHAPVSPKGIEVSRAITLGR